MRLYRGRVGGLESAEILVGPQIPDVHTVALPSNKGEIKRDVMSFSASVVDHDAVCPIVE